MIQDCFKIEKELMKWASNQGKKEGGNKSVLYRKAIIEYKEKIESVVKPEKK